MKNNHDAALEFVTRVKEGTLSFVITADGKDFTFATRLLGGGKVVCGWDSDDSPLDDPVTVAFVRPDGTVVVCMASILKKIGVMGSDYEPVETLGVVSFSEMKKEAQKIALETAQEFYENLPASSEDGVDIEAARHDYAYGTFAEEPNLEVYKQSLRATQWILGFEDIRAIVLENLVRDKKRLAAEKQVREFLLRAEERGKIPESVFLPWEVEMLRAVHKAKELGAKTVRVVFRSVDGTEAVLHVSPENVRQEILDRTTERPVWWHLESWDVADGRPKFEAVVELLGSAPRMSDAEKITYGAKTLYVKEAYYVDA